MGFQFEFRMREVNLTLYKPTEISPHEALVRLQRDPQLTAIDVRSPSEFGTGHLPGTRNFPVLSDEHRHLVGICYKQNGQQSAITLGHELVAPMRERMVDEWVESLSRSTVQPGLIFCWRGGLRSHTAGQWLFERGVDFQLVTGGYKGMRRLLLQTFADYPSMLVIGGMTGTGKTALLRQFSDAIDLEAMANHRGSAFGSLYLPPQPTQQTFENSIAMRWFGGQGPWIIEDESRTIGSCVLPQGMYEHMAACDSLIVEASLEERSLNIYRDYVLAAKSAGETPEQSLRNFVQSLDKIAKRLGGALTIAVRDVMGKAFATGFEARAEHQEWIAMLLSEYYDRQYIHALGRKQRRIVFSGDLQACRQWLQEHLDAK